MSALFLLNSLPRPTRLPCRPTRIMHTEGAHCARAEPQMNRYPVAEAVQSSAAAALWIVRGRWTQQEYKHETPPTSRPLSNDKEESKNKQNRLVPIHSIPSHPRSS